MRKFALAAALICGIATPAFASTLPGADDHTTIMSGGIGNELGIAIDGTFAPNTRIGFGLGTPTWGFSPDYDLRLSHEFATGMQGFDVAVLGGVYGFGTAAPSGMELGAGLSFELTPRLELRANPVFGLGFWAPGQTTVWAPAAGFEFGYKFTSEFEGTLGYNARGEILGMRFQL